MTNGELNILVDVYSIFALIFSIAVGGSYFFILWGKL